MYYDLSELIPIESKNAGKVITIAVGNASVIIISEKIDISDSDIWFIHDDYCK
jgi:frataxin-like iron-binding protein CyaY